MRRTSAALLVGLLAASTFAAAAPGDVTAELSARDGRTAVSLSGDSRDLFLGGEVPAGSEPTAILQALDHADAVLEAYDVSSDVVVTDGAVSGSVRVSCLRVPGCDGTTANSPERQAALDALGGYRLQLTVDAVSDLSGIVDFDPYPPVITSYALTSPTTVLVRFSEDVVDPDGDAASDWEIDDLRQVHSVQGTGDSRTLTFVTPYPDGATPNVLYLPTPPLDSESLPNRPYVDRAGNELDADGRMGLAADAIPPPVPSIESIEGTDVTYEAEDRAVPVLGNHDTPEVVIGDVADGAIAQLYRDDGDGTFEPGADDVLVGEQAGDGSGSVTIEATPLPDGVHRFYARSRDEALCDPNDESQGTCPNHSGRSQEARYDLDTVAPVPTGDALASTTTITVQFTEPLIGADGPAQWTVTNPDGDPVTVTGVTGSGDVRTLQVSGGPVVPSGDPTLAWTAPGSNPYRDRHGNVLTGFPIPVAAAPLPVVTVEAADVTEGDPPVIATPLDPPPTLDFTLQVDGLAQGQQVEIAYETVGGTEADAAAGNARAGVDYEPADDTVTVTGDADAGAPDQVVVGVKVIRDTLHEFDEPVVLQVRDVEGETNLTFPGGAESLTTSGDILDDDDPVVATIDPAERDVAEDAGSTTLAVQLDTVSGRPVTIDWATSVASDPGAGDADASDVPAQSGTVVIPAGEDAATFTVEIADDAVDEPDETFTVELSASDGANATLGDPSSAVVTIIDDDVPVPELTVEPGAVDEDDYPVPVLTNAELPFTFRLSEAPEQPIEISWTTDGSGTATQDVDFTGASGFVRFETDETEQTVLIDVIDDDLNEDPETVAMVVADPAAATLVGAVGGSATFEGTIIDDDPLPAVAFADGSANRAVTEGHTATFTVELSQVSGRDVEVDWATVFDGTATTGDLPDQSDTLTIPEGQPSETFEVTTKDTEVADGDRTVSIELSAPSNAELGSPSTSRLTITDDEVVTPVITLTGGEGNEDPGLLPPFTSPTPVRFTIELSHATDQDVTVRYRTTAGGTATAESDFTATSGTVTIPAEITSATVDVAVLDDDLDEPDETVELELSQPAHARFDDGGPTLTGFGTIRDNDDPVTVSLGEDAVVDEGESVVLDVTLDAPSGKTVQVDYETVHDTADDRDYVPASGTLTFDPDAGETTKQITVQTRDDAEFEGDEKFRVVLTDAVNAELGDAEAVVTITHDDELATQDNVLSLSSASTSEGDPPPVGVLPFPPRPTLDFSVSLQEPADGPVEVFFEAATDFGDHPATAGGDFEAGTGTVTIPDQGQATTISIEVHPDLLDEFDETMVLRVTGVEGNAVVPGGELSRTGRILDDDDPVEVAFADGSVEVTEGDVATLTVELDAVSGKDVTVAWATSYNGTATTDDVPRQSGTVTIPSGETTGQTTVSFDVATTDNHVRDGDRDVSVVLSDPRNATLSDDRPTTATVTILDDEPQVLTIVGGEVDEGATGTLGRFDPGVGLEAASVGGVRSADADGEPGLVAAAVGPLEEDLVFTVTLAEPATQDVTVRYRTTDAGTAVAGSDPPEADYRATSGTLTILRGETEGTVAVDVVDDDIDEFDETVVVRFSEPSGAVFANGRDTVDVAGTIIDDDPLVVVSLGDDVEVAEGELARFDVLLDAVSGKDITVRYRTRNGSAVAGQDLRATNRTLTIPAGETEASFTVPTLDDSIPESTEQAEVVLSVVEDDRGPTAALGRSVATLGITDDDVDIDANVVSMSGDAVEEGDPLTPLGLPVARNELVFELRLSEPADGDVVVDFETRPGTATADDDFTPTSDQVTVASGSDRATVAVEVVPDLIDEFDEDLELVLTGVSGDAVLPGGELARTGRVLDDDPRAQLRVSDATVLEGDAAELEVTLDNRSGKPITVAWTLVDGTATAGEDYVAHSGTLAFPAGTTSRTVQVATLPDADTGELIEQLELVLSGATNAGIADGRGTISIVDVGLDGLPTTTAIFLSDVRTVEGDADHVIQVPVRLSSARDTDTAASWSTQRLTAADGDDYVGGSGDLVIPAGQTEASIPITIIGDTEAERDEDFLVLLTEADGAIITGPTGRVTITDDDSDGDGGGGDGGRDDGGDGGSGDLGGTGDDPSGAPDSGAGQLPATGGGAGFAVLGLALLAARRRRDR